MSWLNYDFAELNDNSFIKIRVLQNLLNIQTVASPYSQDYALNITNFLENL